MKLHFGASGRVNMRSGLIEAYYLAGGVVEFIVVELELEKSGVEWHFNLRRELREFDVHLGGSVVAQ